MENLDAKLEAFRARLEADQLEGLKRHGVDCEPNRHGVKCWIKGGKKYAHINVGSSGKYVVVLATGEIFGIKGYGVIHRGYQFGTLDIIADYEWGEYRAIRRRVAA